MYFDYPNDAAAYRNTQQYMFGDDLLVAPITTAGTGPNRVARQAVWFPKGWWYDYFTGERIESDGTVEKLVSADIHQFPLYFRGGKPVPMQPYTQRMTTAKLETLLIRVYPGPDRQTGTFMLYEDDGVSSAYLRGESSTTQISYTRDGEQHTIDVHPTKGSFAGQVPDRIYVISLVGVKGAATVRIRRQPIDRPARAVITAAVADSPAPPKREQVGLVAANDGPYGFGGNHVVRFYAPRGVIDDDRFTWIVGPQRGQTTVSERPFELPQARRNLDEISFQRKARVEFNIDGKQQADEVDLPFDPAILDSQRNVARHATVTASSTEKDYDPKGAIDGRVSGYPASKAAEWASDREKQNATIRLEWPTPQTIQAIALFDRPNTHDHVVAGEITFSDGGTIEIGKLANDASEPLELKISPRTITWMTLKITQSGSETQNAGISEIAVFPAKK
jgi:hypothetical protein